MSLVTQRVLRIITCWTTNIASYCEHTVLILTEGTAAEKKLNIYIYVICFHIDILSTL